MTHLLTITGIISACITDDAGRMLAFEGDAVPPTAAVLVLAHATLSAASEMGRRSGSGDCVELVQHHDGGLILLRSLSGQRALLVRCMPGTDMAAVSHAAANWDAEPAPAAPQPVYGPDFDLADAFLAAPSWK